MAITRPGETPHFYVYPTQYALTNSDGDSRKWPNALKNYDPNPILIPNYQRRIVWDKKRIREFIDSTSTLFGTVILASTTPNVIILIDGLQRFATATAILNYLYQEVLSPNPNRKSISQLFVRLQAEVTSKEPIFSHNDKMLLENTRTGIRNSYKNLKKDVESILKNELDKNTPDVEIFAKNIVKTFVTKQIAIDTYFGFKNDRELIHTFINLNSTGLNLTEVDLLRSEIVQQANKCNWSDDDKDEMENRFTEIFQTKIKWTKILGKNLYDVLDETRDGTLIFKDWNSLKKEHVDELLDFIEEFDNAVTAKDSKSKSSAYLSEILNCGRLPITLVFWYYYKYIHLKNKTPDFISKEGVNTNKELHLILRAFYRKFIDGTIGRIGPIVTEFIQCSDPISDGILEKLATKINKDIGADELGVDVDKNWLKTSLRKSGKDKSPRIFNACLLPNRDDEGGHFEPLEFGGSKTNWQIDHLIPKADKTTNKFVSEELEQLANFAPLPGKINAGIKHNPCKEKIGPNGAYHAAKNQHPYIYWLISEHYKTYESYENTINDNHPLNDSSCLIMNAAMRIGDDRIEKIMSLLKNKL